MKSVLPNKKNVILAIFALLVLTIGFFALGYGDKYLYKDNLPKEDDSISMVNQAMDSLNKDSDNDGLKDWEEALWKTDIDNPDTDGDGALDGDEVNQGRDPLKPGPDDKLEEKISTSLSQGGVGVVSNPTSSSVNLTDLLSKNLSLQAGNGISPLSADNQDILDKANSSTEALLKDFIASFSPVLSENEFNVSSDNSKTAIEKYNKELEQIFYDIPYPKKTEGEVFIEVAKTNNISLVDPYIDYYKKMIIRMKRITVPSSFVEDHKRWVEYSVASLRVSENMKEVKRDPLKTIIAIQENERIKNEFAVFIAGFGNRISDLIK
ncbi:MAG: thrombospondin type 3 repeat-containing protein [Parcubacteria group bacterium]|nr:thrombospondin type 3 repeat-containing protein [Parcubacteria group bacterium]MCR4342738.1 thrombospondin type 3 repeat-containing protein [Patescibacteria group bacterium]